MQRQTGNGLHTRLEHPTLVSRMHSSIVLVVVLASKPAQVSSSVCIKRHLVAGSVSISNKMKYTLLCFSTGIADCRLRSAIYIYSASVPPRGVKKNKQKRNGRSWLAGFEAPKCTFFFFFFQFSYIISDPTKLIERVYVWYCGLVFQSPKKYVAGFGVLGVGGLHIICDFGFSRVELYGCLSS